jgi:hypothetical protein
MIIDHHSAGTQSSESETRETQGVIFAEEVNGELISNLAENPEIFAIVIPHFYPSDIASKLAEASKNSEHLLGYQQAPSILRTGITFSETESSPEMRDIYYQKALSQINETRKICWPYVSPVDLLRLQLDERYPYYGSHLMRLGGDRVMFSGLIRAFEPGVGADPHQDVIFWDSNRDPHAFLYNQIAANIYLQTQPQGGELELWDHKCNTQAEYDALRDGDSYGLDHRKLGAPTISIKPEVGNLILFESTRVHAVRPGEGCSRITMSTFIGYNKNQPLQFFS